MFCFCHSAAMLPEESVSLYEIWPRVFRDTLGLKTLILKRTKFVYKYASVI